MLPALLQIQYDVTARLTIELEDWGITVRSQRKMIVQNEVDESQLVVTTTNGKNGCGCLVQMPKFENERPNVPGPLGYMELTVTAMESPELNMNGATGTRRSAEEVAARVLQLLQLYCVATIGTFFGGSLNSSEAPEGCIAYDVKMRMAYGHDVLAKTPTPAITGTHTAVTITASSGTAYYTTDGESFPGPDQVNSFEYSVPFAVAVGTVIRAAAYASGYTGSNVAESTIST